ncbi:MAG: bifunctional folylpolyglutamate synthase/dihydrofolate synthase [Bacteroidaceae bacterium]|nr:bifunctional folylpolyglutamate synthase/dihydrofolate synthase [Bacteroidaceae bacterium]
MTYQETITYLYNSAPLFQNIGQGAYKEGLSNTHALDEHFGHPHRTFRTLHVAGTNGKGSCSHTLAAVLQAAGYKVGLYTSPHLVDFRERIRVNGMPIEEQFVVDFVAGHRDFFEPLHPSFFELTTAMAFHYFAEQQVDVAVIEVGLGGRLDCTNIISPDLTVITNISFDHVGFLGDTLGKIAHEKAGIIKPHTPIIIGEHNEETRPVFLAEATEKQAPITFAQDTPIIVSKNGSTDYDIYQTHPYSDLQVALRGYCQEKNVNTLLHAIGELQRIGYTISEEAVREGFARVCELTGLMGRWQQLSTTPRLICDTGHNIGGFQYIVPQILAQPCKQLRIVFGMVNDKDINAVLALMPKHATYYFAQASVARALDSESLQALAAQHGLYGTTYPTVKEATRTALAEADKEDFIYVGGSSFIVADLLADWREIKN